MSCMSARVADNTAAAASAFTQQQVSRVAAWCVIRVQLVQRTQINDMFSDGNAVFSPNFSKNAFHDLDHPLPSLCSVYQNDADVQRVVSQFPHKKS